MTTASSHAMQLLDELSRTAVENRTEMLRARGPIEPTLASLIDHAAQLTSVDAAKAVDATDIVVNLADRLGTQLDRARARRARARALSYAGRFDDALAVAREGARVAEEAGHAIEAGRARLASMHALGEMGRLDEAIRTGEAARESFLAVGELSLAARADINLGTAHQRRDDPAKAVECFERAKPHLLGETLIIGHLENNRGEALLALNDFTGAEQAFRSALCSFQAAGATMTAAIAEGNLADLAARQGKLHEAVYHFELSRRLFESNQATGHLARLLAEQAEALSVLGMPRDALAQYEAALTKLDECGLALEAARARSGMGQMLLRLNRMAQAETSLAAAASAFEELGHSTARAKVDLIRAELALRNGRLTDASTMVLRAMAALQDRPAETVTARHLLAQIAIAQNRFDEATADLNAGLAIANRLDLPPLKADLLFTRGKLQRHTGQLNGSVADLTRAVEEVERVRGALQAERFRAAFLGDRTAIYEELVLALLSQHGQQSVENAWTVVENAKSRAMLEQMRAMGSVSPANEHISAMAFKSSSVDASHRSGDDAITAKISQVTAELNALYSRLGDEQRRLDDQSWRTAVRSREAELLSLETRLSATQRISLHSAAALHIADLRSIVPDNSAVLEYFIAGDELIAFVIDGRRVHAHSVLASVSELVQVMRRLQFQINRALRPGALESGRMPRLLDDAKRELAALYDLIFAPLKSEVDSAQRLFIIPHGPLHLLPFHALWDGAQYLVESHEIVYAPSARMLLHLHPLASESRVSNTGCRQPLVVGVHDEAAPQIAQEASQVAAALDCPPQRMLLDAHATAPRVRAALETASVAHLACHGRFTPDSPLASGLKLADRWFTVRDICNLRISPDLITLSACETGMSLVNSGDELMGLLRGFFVAGARSMLVSQWRIDDRTSADFMTAFYESYARSSDGAPTKAAILRETHMRFLREWEHPALWAPFLFVGGVEQ